MLDALEAHVQWERDVNEVLRSQSPPVTPWKWAVPEVGSLTARGTLTTGYGS